MRASLALALVLLLPLASAEPVVVEDSTEGDPSCSGEPHEATTRVAVEGLAEAQGFRQCGTMADGREVRAEGIFVWTPVTQVHWIAMQAGDEETCFMAVVPFGVRCPAPPPALPWGSLLP